jgi:hypothetical protein
VGLEVLPPARARRWPWVVAVLAVLAGVAVALRQKKADDHWTPAPTGDGPVPSYREDPVPSAPSSPAAPAGGTESPQSQSQPQPEGGKTVSSAQAAPGDATPTTSDLGTQPQQLTRDSDDRSYGNRPGTATGSGNDFDAPVTTAGGGAVTEGAGAVDPSTDATNATETARGAAGTPVANRGVEPEDGSSKA